jgi:epoxyqueuosine reductase
MALLCSGEEIFMEVALCEEISRFIREDSTNQFPGSTERYFEEPLVRFVSATDPLFAEYKTVIGEFHLTPFELVAESTPEDVWAPVTVISWVLPISDLTKSSNNCETVYPSEQWSRTRNLGEDFNNILRLHVIKWLNSKGYRAAAPVLMTAWRTIMDTPVGVASSWSERHAAYAAGSGTFSLNDALITPKGIAHRLGSVITDLELAPSGRFYEERRSNCLYYREGTCGVCISRCPAGAISVDGHDKKKCLSYVYETIPKAVGERYGVKIAGCGLCQTKVPCESHIPIGRSAKHNLGV